MDTLSNDETSGGKFIKVASILNTGLMENKKRIDVDENVRINVNILTL
jgi:hypothetical protein